MTRPTSRCQRTKRQNENASSASRVPWQSAPRCRTGWRRTSRRRRRDSTARSPWRRARRMTAAAAARTTQGPMTRPALPPPGSASPSTPISTRPYQPLPRSSMALMAQTTTWQAAPRTKSHRAAQAIANPKACLKLGPSSCRVAKRGRKGWNHPPPTTAARRLAPHLRPCRPGCTPQRQRWMPPAKTPCPRPPRTPSSCTAIAISPLRCVPVPCMCPDAHRRTQPRRMLATTTADSTSASARRRTPAAGTIEEVRRRRCPAAGTRLTPQGTDARDRRTAIAAWVCRNPCSRLASHRCRHRAPRT
mmetsp:Transcript_19631/g.55426  ORF Transcript_19631/g.55426 Transcript_19631/m.55426 type:complete len:304 (+) Transcript_19631:638-1549(+)